MQLSGDRIVISRDFLLTQQLQPNELISVTATREIKLLSLLENFSYKIVSAGTLVVTGAVTLNCSSSEPHSIAIKAREIVGELDLTIKGSVGQRGEDGHDGFPIDGVEGERGEAGDPGQNGGKGSPVGSINVSYVTAEIPPHAYLIPGPGGPGGHGGQGGRGGPVRRPNGMSTQGPPGRNGDPGPTGDAGTITILRENVL